MLEHQGDNLVGPCFDGLMEGELPAAVHHIQVVAAAVFKYDLEDLGRSTVHNVVSVPCFSPDIGAVVPQPAGQWGRASGVVVATF